MIESTARRTPQLQEIDLLPWADPYIAQLFHEAQPLCPPGLMGFVQDSPIGQDDRRIQHAVKSPWDCVGRNKQPEAMPELYSLAAGRVRTRRVAPSSIGCAVPARHCATSFRPV